MFIVTIYIFFLIYLTDIFYIYTKILKLLNDRVDIYMDNKKIFLIDLYLNLQICNVSNKKISYYKFVFQKCHFS